MTNLRWATDPAKPADHCPSCTAAAGQVHSAEAWHAAGLFPRSPRLICGDLCRCTLEPTEDAESGDLAAIPLHEGEEPMPPTETQLLLSATGHVQPSGTFEILAITAGDGNGWQFSAAVLQASLPLWERVECFVDHGQLKAGRSVRDLAGVCHSPTWSTAAQGITLQLRPSGPCGQMLEDLGREMLSEADPKPNVGFSADLLFIPGPDNTVKSILRVLSLDCVFDPARGGAFVRALNQAAIRREKTMADPVTPPAGAPPATPPADPNLEAMRTLLRVQTEQEAQRVANEQALALHVEMCSHVLAAALTNSRLPEAAQAPIRARFTGKAFEAKDLNAAIDEQRTLVAALTAGSIIAGPGRVHAMFDTGDALQAAVDDLLQAPRDAATAKLQVHRLSGVRELYHLLTGDFDFHGAVYPSRISLQHTTANFTGLVKNAMNKALIDRWNELGRAGYTWWEKIAHVEHFDTLNTITWMITGSIGTLPVVGEGGEYTELKIGDSPETSSLTKYGGYIGLTLEALDRDDTRSLRMVPRELANASLRRISALVAAVFTDNSAVGPTMTDTGALFNATAVTTAGGHANLLTTALSAAQWEVVKAAVYNQPLLVANESGYYGTGAKVAVNPRYLLVPRALELTGRQILYPNMERAANIFSENLQQGQPGDVITVPEWTDSTDWAAVVDPALMPGICIGERFGLKPEIFVAGDELSPAVFMNDESRLKVRQFVAVGVADFRPLHKSNV